VDHAAAPFGFPEDFPLNLARDGGRRVMYGGNAYEDELEAEDGAGQTGDALSGEAGSKAFM
jgi:hypothetical protein